MTNNRAILLEEECEIDTERLLLRKFRLDDSRDFYEYAKESRTVEHLTWLPHEDENRSKYVIEQFYLKQNVYAVILKSENKGIGSIGIHMDEVNNKAILGYVISPYYQRNGYGSEVVRKILSYCFYTLEVNRVEACHYNGNEGSKKILLNNGFTFEGVSKEDVFTKGKYRDVYRYGITRKEYKRI